MGEVGVQSSATLGDVVFLSHEFVADLSDARKEFGAVATRMLISDARQDVADDVGRQITVGPYRWLVEPRAVFSNSISAMPWAPTGMSTIESRHASAYVEKLGCSSSFSNAGIMADGVDD